MQYEMNKLHSFSTKNVILFQKLQLWLRGAKTDTHVTYL